ncbi:MAG: adenylate/guanylate cyclase domain-containing protein [Desulfobulbaceae bacterium]|nr:adenylate/guanylate cyclase domain-containing protein [Desulfobulbaceae bacterium]
MDHKSFSVRWHDVLIHSVVGITVALLFWFTGLLNGIEGKTFDLRASLLAGRSPFSDSIVLIVIDQESIDWVSENMEIGWPWPRELFGSIIVNCIRRGAESIGFDVLFTENSNFGVADDIKLKNAMLQAGYFTLGSVFPSNASGKSTAWPEDIPKPHYNIDNKLGFLAQLPSYSRATFPVSDLLSEGIVLSNVQHQPDDDGIYRKIHPFVLFDEILLPSLGSGIYLSSHPDAEIIVGQNQIVVDGHAIPVDHTGSALLNFRKPKGTYRFVSAASVIRNEFQFRNNEIGEDEIKDDLAGKYVLFGYIAPGLRDLRPTPTDGSFSGVEINATILDNLLAEDFIRPVTTLQTIFRIILLTFSATFFLTFFHTQRAQIAVALLIPLFPISLAVLFYKFGYDFKLIPIELAVITGTTLSIIHRYLVVGKQERFIRHSFKHYLSPVVINQLMENPDKLKLGGERKELSIFFSDLEGFTTISEGLGAEELTHLLNKYLTEMTDIIMEEQGTVDKFEGDAIIAFWNAPLEVANHAEFAVRAALRCQQRLSRIRPALLEEYGKRLHMRIGINTGYAVAGNMGSSTRFDYTVLGDAVNLAARLEGANKNFGTYTMITEATFNKIGENFSCRELAKLRVVGRKEAVRVYEPLSYTGNGSEKNYQSFHQGLIFFYEGKIKQAFDEFVKTADQDRAAKMYALKCQKLLGNIPESWEGVWELDCK